jgi:hypothetical protein
LGDLPDDFFDLLGRGVRADNDDHGEGNLSQLQSEVQVAEAWA